MLHFFAKRFNELQEVKRDERGFTLIELLVVVIIIGILAAIAIPAFLGQRERAQDANAKSLVRNAASTMQACYTDTRKYTACDASALQPLEPNITFQNAVGALAVDDQVAVTGLSDSPDKFQLSSTSESGTQFLYNYTDGDVSRTTDAGGDW